MTHIRTRSASRGEAKKGKGAEKGAGKGKAAPASEQGSESLKFDDDQKGDRTGGSSGDQGVEAWTEAAAAMECGRSDSPCPWADF